MPIIIRNTQPQDIEPIVALSKLVYPWSATWPATPLVSHRTIFPEGQFVAIDTDTDTVVGMAASLVVRWADYGDEHTWAQITGNGMFTNHNPHGQTLYAAEVMVDPRFRRRGIGRQLYAARRELVERMGLRCIRAGARLRGYSKHAEAMSPEAYVAKVLRKELSDPTLSFQISQGFRVLRVVHDYLPRDPESLGHVALIEWLNPKIVGPVPTDEHPFSQTDEGRLAASGG